MAGIITLSPRTNFANLRDEFRYTAARLNKHKWTTALRAPFMAFNVRLSAGLDEEDALLTRLEECNAARQFLDRELDNVVDMVVGVTGNRRGPGLYRELFGNKRVFEFKRPILNEQLDAMASWLETLAGRTDPVLVLVVEKLAALIPQATEAHECKKSAQAQLVVFRETGTRAQAVAAFNGLRKTTFGSLSKLQHEHKQSTGWAESFFRQSKGGVEELSLSSVEQQIASNAAEGAYLQTVHRELVAKQAAEQETARLAEERARQAAITGKREELARLEAELAELEGTS